MSRIPNTDSFFSAQICWNCGRPASETCSGCKVAKYCGSFCQHKDWESHHRVCRATQEELAAAATPGGRLVAAGGGRSYPPEDHQHAEGAAGSSSGSGGGNKSASSSPKEY
jgi:hypothetical protein